MIDVSTVEFRYFIRLLTKKAVIWNQMVVAETLFYRHLSKENASCELPEEEEEDFELTDELSRYCGWWDFQDGVNPHPTICQIGTNNPKEAKFAVRVAEKTGRPGIKMCLQIEKLNADCNFAQMNNRL